MNKSEKAAIVARAEAFDYIAQNLSSGRSVTASDVSRHLYSKKHFYSKNFISGLDAKSYPYATMDVLDEIMSDGLVEIDAGEITITDDGKETYKMLEETS